MLTALDAQVKRTWGRAEAAAGKAFAYFAEHGLRIVALTGLLASVILLVWAHWAV